jgi:hypothetical protein
MWIGSSKQAASGSACVTPVSKPAPLGRDRRIGRVPRDRKSPTELFMRERGATAALAAPAHPYSRHQASGATTRRANTARLSATVTYQRSRPELVRARERGQDWGEQGSHRHVRLFPMGSVRTSIMGGTRRLPCQRRSPLRRPRLRSPQTSRLGGGGARRASN